MNTFSLWTVFILLSVFSSVLSQGRRKGNQRATAGQYSGSSDVTPDFGPSVRCGDEKIDPRTFICCNGIPRVLTWKEKTECCGENSFNPEIETCCDGLLNPGFGFKNKDGVCCGMFSFDKRCYECDVDFIKPQFDFRHELCCDGEINELKPNQTCCCGQETIDPSFQICCDGVPEKRGKKVATDCCNCGLTKVDIVVVLDASESIQPENWPKMLEFTTKILSEAEIDEDNVRVGLLTYRHNATIEFHLNEYKNNKNRMFSSILDIPYVRGSTNTGLGIETVRTQMFVPENGDRPGVDNVLIVVTDGDSDDFGYTVTQAEIARDYGIHIFAIGIALKNLTELKAIASPPAEQNVLSLNDFEHLDNLKGKIFASICTGTPIPNVYEKCGKDEFYDPSKELCCNGKPHALITGEDTKCCGENSYNTKTQICCEGVVNDFKGKNTVCCGKTAMDVDKELCCGQSPVPRPSKAYDTCCGAYAYNTKTEVCCKGFVNKAFGNPEQDTECCGPVSYDTRCFKCVGKKIKPLFDISCQLCCDGSIQNLTSTDSCCCGKKIFSPSQGAICCDGKLRDRQGAEKKHTCCECGSALVDLAFVIDSSESVGAENWEILLDFVGAVISTADVDDGSTRIAVEVYRHNVTMAFKFNNYRRSANMIDHVKRIPYTRGSTNTGLALEEMREKIFVPQAGDRSNVPDIAIVILDGTSDDADDTKRQAALAKEAGIHIYAITVGQKINDEFKSIASEPWEENVFSATDFSDLRTLHDLILDRVNDVCPQQPTPNRCLDPCGDKMYDPKTEVCCNGEPQLFHGGSAKNTLCCDTEAYSESDEICCNGEVNRRPGKRRKAEALCCDTTAYDPKESVCCRKTDVIPRSGRGAAECCGMSTYDPKSELCCEEVIYENFGDDGKSGACCKNGNRTVSYDTRCYECKKGELEPLYDCAFERCCDGVIQKIDYQNSCCCGKKAFDLDKFMCCDGKINKRKPEDDPGCCECASSIADVVIVLDSSESVGLENWRRMEMFIEDLIKSSSVPDTRFGLCVFRHNTSIEFNLNKFFDIPSMLEAVDNLPYIRGSTNTGLALETVAKDMFTPLNGDRPGAPNSILLITDGQSDEPENTKQQAELTKEQGIHILALGVGLKDIKELRAVASPPADDNAISLKNFDELEVVKQRIFNDLAKSVCPQKPKERCGLPCGDTVYDPLSQVCCNGVPQPIRGSEENTKCCDKVSYDVQKQACCGDKTKTVYDLKTEMCCNGTVNKKPSGKNPMCCDDEAYDPSKAMCCYDVEVIPRAGNGASECCGMATYNPINELCCDAVLYKNYGDDGMSGACCHITSTNRTVSYDTRCYKCVNGELVPLYDCAYQRCCDGVIQEIFSDASCCCGKKAFDPDFQICCNKKLRDRKPDDDRKCCECASNIVDIVIILDSSESVGEDNWKQMEVFVESLIEESAVPDVRFGLLTYKHDTQIEFPLNKYFDKNSLLEAVDKLPYNRGSTNTGLALKVLRQKMFTPQTGDRPIAPNFALLITDGQSDDPKQTEKEAQLAKDQGIHIIALGVGLKDDKELRAVASSPADDNAIALKNFAELKAVKQRIFKDLAKSVCPQRPEPRCGTPCGNTTIDERYEICCEGVPHKKMAGDKTKCCGTVAYDPDCFICCEENSLVSKYAGDATECCCKWAYDSRTHLCCGNSILPKVAGKFSSCCHNETYDTRTQVCCDYMYVQPSYGEGNTECCNGKSYDSRCDECRKNSIAPLYNVKEELCCGGKIQNKKFEDRSCCCGTKQFDADVGICCEDNYFDRPKGDEVTCCGPNIHNSKKEICCNDKVNPRLNGFDTKCCGQKSYHPKKHHCCELKLNKKKSPGDTCCCGNKVFDFTKKICCDGKAQKLAKPGNRSSSVCCGKKSFDPTKQICCANKVNKLSKSGASTICCGKKAYDPSKQKCENGKVVKIGNECNNRRYDQKSQMCCNGFINNGTIKDPWARCCFGDAYDARKKVCCCNGNLEDAVAGIYTQCCYSIAYDSRTHTCCDGQIVRKPYPSAECCCERQAYDSNREICCGGKVRACGGDKTRCCDTEAYDPVLEICCDGKLHDRRYGEETYCCGDEAYTPTLAACCGGRIAYTKEVNLIW